MLVREMAQAHAEMMRLCLAAALELDDPAADLTVCLFGGARFGKHMTSVGRKRCSRSGQLCVELRLNESSIASHALVPEEP